jgi:PAS domain-containing protein
MPKEDVVGKNVWELFPDLVDTEVYRQLQGAVAEQTSVHFEHFYPMWQGWFESRVYPSANGVSILTIEITARKQAEEAWRESEGRFQAFMNHSPVAAFIKDEAGRYIYLKPLVEELFQYTPDDLVGKTDFDLLPAEVGLGYAAGYRLQNRGINPNFGLLAARSRTYKSMVERAHPSRGFAACPE